MNEVISRNYLVDQVLEHLRQRLRAGIYGVGDRLPAEVALARELGVSRSTIREAMRVLTHLGIVQTSTGRGTFVLRDDVSHSVPTTMPWADVADIVKFRYALEVEAAAEAAEHRSDAAMEMLWQAYERLRGVDDGATAEDLANVDLDFHVAVIAASGNNFLVGLYGDLRPRLIAALVSLIGVNEGSSQSIQAIARSVHAPLVAAIQRKDAKTAVAEVRRDHHEAEVRLRMLLDNHGHRDAERAARA